MFIDYAKIFVQAGKGGDGAVAFRREKFIPKGGPAGGNGGKGGNIILKTDSNLHTLLDFRYTRKYNAENGVNGANFLKDGKSGKDLIIKVPVGTLAKDKASGEVIADLSEKNLKLVIAKGGRGGKGNSNFATSTNRTPRYAQDGKAGDEFDLVLELKLIADVGLVGFPNAGKSTLISTISSAKPKIADYPFTTLKPNLGIVRYKDFKSFTVADIPGIIEGASLGKGLGHEFLKHIERTELLLILIDVTTENFKKDYNVLLKELSNYSPILSKKKKIVSFSKIDLIPKDELQKLQKEIKSEIKEEVLFFSAIANINLNLLLNKLWEHIEIK
ncbi:MAG: GTPase ObgE [Melioribacteraceae bacterium]